MSVDEITTEISERLVRANDGLRESRSAGVNSPWFNQYLGERDGLESLLQWIVDNG